MTKPWVPAVASALVVAVSVMIGAGTLDWIAPEGALDRAAAIGALLLYWVFVVTVVWVIPAGIAHPRYAALVLGSTAVALILAELTARAIVPGADAVRLTSGGLPSPELHHILPPRARMYVGRFEGKDVFLETNADGLRTRYSKEAFRQHRERVIVLGDSFAFGLGVADEDTFAGRLEARLRREAGHDSVAVLNAGVISYSPFLARLLLERRLVDYQPTLVLLLLDATDIGDDYRYMGEAVARDGRVTFPFAEEAPAPYRGALFELSRRYHRQITASARYPLDLAREWASDTPSRRGGPYDYYEFSVTVGDTLEENRFFIYRHPLDVTRPFFDRTAGNVDAIAQLTTRIGAGFALVVTPRYHHWNAQECPENWEKYKYAVDEPYQFEYFRYFDELTRSYPILNLLPDFQRTDRYPLVFRHDPHWNAAGHAFVAEAVHRHLVGRGMFPRPGVRGPRV